MKLHPGTRSLKKYIIFPCCLLVFGAIEELAEYKSAAIGNQHLQVLGMMLFFTVGISILAFGVTPILEGVVLKFHKASKSGAGRWGELVFTALLLAAVYILWYVLLIHGPQYLLPPTWR
jgi:hypothetical protein